MFDPIATGLVVWASAGLVVALAFLLFGFDRIDPAARDAYLVRPLLVPALCSSGLWSSGVGPPFRGEGDRMQRHHRRAHALIWTGLAVTLPIALLIIFASVPELPDDAPAVRLDAQSGQGGGQ